MKIDRRRVRELYDKGLSAGRIGIELGVSRQAVHYHIRLLQERRRIVAELRTR